MDIGSESDSDSLPCITNQTEKGELSDPVQDLSLANVDQALSEEQTYRETMLGIRSNMDCSHIPDAEDNSFTAS